MGYDECVSRFQGLYGKREVFIENMSIAINKEQFEQAKQWLSLASGLDLQMSEILIRLAELKSENEE